MNVAVSRENLDRNTGFQPVRSNSQRLKARVTRKRLRPRGYVLLVTLALLVLSTTLLVAVVRAAAHHTLQARLEQADLQQRWGAISCRTAVLQNAERILVDREQQEHRAVPELRATVSLGDDSFTLIVADESAKANVNQTIEQFGLQGAGDRIRQALSGTGLVNAVRLRPGFAAGDATSPTTRPAGPPQLIWGPGQMFDSVGPDRLIGAQAGNAPVMQSLTCWGSGAINLMRADQQSMRLALTPALTQLEISRLIAARDSVLQIPITSHIGSNKAAGGSSDAIGSLLSQAHIDAGRRNRLALTSRSTCHSLWIIAVDGRRQWHCLTVADESNPRQPVTRSLVW